MYSERRLGSVWLDVFAENAQVLSILAFFIACLVVFTIGSEHFLTALAICSTSSARRPRSSSSPWP